jgi:tRNA(Ile)-lysidine synthase
MEPAAFLQAVARAIAAEGLLRPSERVLVGLSGGPDSVVLLHSLIQLGYSVVAAHFDHGLRASSADEALWVADRCADWGVEFLTARASAPGLLLGEASAREARYAFLESAAASAHANAIVLGHHADDQAETVLFRLIRGAGPVGLAAMLNTRITPSGRRLVRPLLRLRRSDVEAVRQAWGLEALVDESNSDIRFARNRLRQEVVPALAAINSAAVAHLESFAASMRESAANGQEIAQRLAKFSLNWLDNHQVEVDRATLLALPLAGAHWLLIAAFARIDAPRLPTAGLTRCLKTAQFGGNCDLGEGYRVEAAGVWLVISGPAPQPPESPMTTLGVQATQSWGWEVRVSRCNDLRRAECLLVGFDAAQLPQDLVWRSAHPDVDRFQPWGRSRLQGLGTFLTRQGITAHRQRTLLVLASGSTVAWVVGIRRGALAPVTEQTTEVVEMQATAGFRV